MIDMVQVYGNDLKNLSFRANHPYYGVERMDAQTKTSKAHATVALRHGSYERLFIHDSECGWQNQYFQNGSVCLWAKSLQTSASFLQQHFYLPCRSFNQATKSSKCFVSKVLVRLTNLTLCILP
jgi:hypothetical protein